MQIVIPMSGFGERFRKAGYDVPKPLIEVDGRPMIRHVAELFPGETDIVFICNREHLDEPRFRMERILREACPTARILAIEPHRNGPVHAVMQAEELIDPKRPVVVNYCDFACFWDWPDFKAFVAETGCAGAVPCYRGFHPHSLGSTYYAYVRGGPWAEMIREKEPFTDDPASEFASSGTYYFATGDIMFDAFREMIARDLRVNGEFYVSMAYRPLLDAKRPVAVYELQHFMQWGTPEDLAEYRRWSALFRRLGSEAAGRSAARHGGALVVPMAGEGRRFSEAGYQEPKPLLDVCGSPMVVRAALDMPRAPRSLFVTRRDLPGNERVVRAILAEVPGAEIVELPGLTEGQACTALEGARLCDQDAPLSIAPCDGGALFEAEAFETAPAESDVLVWGVRGHAAARRKPESYSWIDADAAGRVRRISLKRPLSDPGRDPVVLGAFTFRRAGDFVSCAERLIASGERVNGEFYADAVVDAAIEAGLRVRLFEVDHYMGWGTPDEYRTFRYWQSCFHKWPSHPYRLEDDPRVSAAARGRLERDFAARKPARPAPVGIGREAEP